MSPQKRTRRFGLPFGGYQSSGPPHLTPPDKATSDGASSSRRSTNWLYNPVEGKFSRRLGTARVGANGILEDASGEISSTGVCRQLIGIRSPNAMDDTLSNTEDNFQTRCTLWNDTETTLDDKGCVHFYSQNDNAGSPWGDTTIGDEFSTTTNYPITAAGGVPYSRAWPYLRTTDDSMGRFHSTAARVQSAAGSRKMLDVGDRLYLPNLHGTPWNWNKDWNDTNTDTNDVLRVQHTGHPSPLGLPDINTGTVSAVGPWHDADIFYVSVAYRFEDGSVSMPIIPRDPNDDVDYDPGLGNMTGFGKVQISSAGTTRYEWIVWQNIPIGPPGTVGRYLLRTPKNAEGANENPSPLDLRITAYLDNNTATTYNDPFGNDLALVADPLLVRFDHIMQPPARYIGTCDGRIVVGYTKPHPAAIYLAPFVNVNDGDATIDDTVYSYSLTGGTLTLNKAAGSTTITNIGSISLQRLVDKINNTTSGGSGGKWFACLAPGADGSALCDDVGTAADNDNLVSVTGATDFSGDGNGIVRGWSPSWPAVIFFSSTYRAAYKTAKRRIFFTMGGPGMPTSAADSWAAGNYRDAPESYGDFMGTAPLASGAVCCFSRGIMVLQNRKSGISGEDVDYRLWEVNASRGCIAPGSIVAFNGAVGYMTADGFVVTDGKDEVVISGDVWNAATQTGEWAYEITQSAKGAASDTDLSRCDAAVMGGKLYITYRLTSSDSAAAEHMLVYDFTGSAQYSGLRGVLRADGSPWGWSTPLVAPVSWGPMGEVVTSSGISRYSAMHGRAVGMTATGRIYQFETGADDDGTDFTSNLWTARDIADTLKKKHAQEIALLYKKNGTGVKLYTYRDGLGATQSGTEITLPTTSTDNFKKKQLPLEQKKRCASDSLEFLITDDGSGTDATQIYGFDLDLVIADSHT